MSESMTRVYYFLKEMNKQKKLGALSSKRSRNVKTVNRILENFKI